MSSPISNNDAIMQSVSEAFGGADVEYRMIKTGAFVRVGGVPVGVIPHEMLNDPQADRFGSVIRDILLNNVFEVIGNAADHGFEEDEHYEQ